MPSDTYTFVLASGYRCVGGNIYSCGGIAFGSSNDYYTSRIRALISDTDKLSTKWGIDAMSDIVYNSIESVSLANEEIVFQANTKGGSGEDLYASCTSEKLFLLSMLEYLCQYRYFADTTANRVYYRGDGSGLGSGNDWWLRSPSPLGGGSSFVRDAGLYPDTPAEHAYYGVRPAFKIEL